MMLDNLLCGGVSGFHSDPSHLCCFYHIIYASFYPNSLLLLLQLSLHILFSLYHLYHNQICIHIHSILSCLTTSYVTNLTYVFSFSSNLIYCLPYFYTVSVIASISGGSQFFYKCIVCF